MKPHKQLWDLGFIEHDNRVAQPPMWVTAPLTTVEFDIMMIDYKIGSLNGMNRMEFPEERAMYCWFFALFFGSELEWDYKLGRKPE